jgi:hypothetical protein
MPVVANTAHRTGRDGSDLLEPCDLSQPVAATGSARFVVHPCSLVAVNGTAMDSYSVLASFGANFEASQSTSATARGGLAQYFATGMAAQLLALNGGASVVAVGEAARESAAHPPPAGEVRSLFGNPAAYSTGAGLVTPYQTFEASLLQRVDAATSNDDLLTKLRAFEQAAGIPAAASIIGSCDTKDNCRTTINDGAYGQIFISRRTQMETALGQWN